MSRYSQEVLAEIEQAADTCECAGCGCYFTDEPIIQRGASSKTLFAVCRDCTDVYQTIPV